MFGTARKNGTLPCAADSTNDAQLAAWPGRVVVGLLFAALIVLTLLGVGTITLVAVLGIILCIAGLFQRGTSIDLWVLVPLLVYVAMNMVSSVITYGTVVYGYGTLELIFPTVYLLAGCLGDSQRNLLRQLCELWAVVAGAIGITMFVVSSFSISVTRLAVAIGSPNALGIMMVLAWFALVTCRMQTAEDGQQPTRLARFLPYTEPILLVTLALTLSMGSFVALAIGILVLILGRKKGRTWKTVLTSGAVVVAKVVLALALGLLIYLAAERAGAPVMGVLGVAYLVAVCFLWLRLEAFLTQRTGISAIICTAGVAVVVLAVVMRPSSFATFAERIDMIGNGIGYLGANPLTGVGPMQWRFLNMEDADTYYNTYHIHNAFVHAGVEFGLIAMACLIVIAVRVFVKKYRQAQHAEDTAFLFHLMTDTGFYFLGVVTMFMLTAGGSTNRNLQLGSAATKVAFAVLGVCHFAIMITYLRML